MILTSSSPHSPALMWARRNDTRATLSMRSASPRHPSTQRRYQLASPFFTYFGFLDKHGVYRGQTSLVMEGIIDTTHALLHTFPTLSFANTAQPPLGGKIELATTQALCITLHAYPRLNTFFQRLYSKQFSVHLFAISSALHSIAVSHYASGRMGPTA